MLKGMLKTLNCFNAFGIEHQMVPQMMLERKHMHKVLVGTMLSDCYSPANCSRCKGEAGRSTGRNWSTLAAF